MWMYITNPKWIKLDELRKIHWSKNEELKNKILKSKDFKSLEEEWFEVKDWLEKIFSWEEISSWSSYNEVYALQLIINETWVSLPYKSLNRNWLHRTIFKKRFWDKRRNNWCSLLKSCWFFYKRTGWYAYFWNCWTRITKKISKYFQ